MLLYLHLQPCNLWGLVRYLALVYCTNTSGLLINNSPYFFNLSSCINYVIHCYFLFFFFLFANIVYLHCCFYPSHRLNQLTNVTSYTLISFCFLLSHLIDVLPNITKRISRFPPPLLTLDGER